MEATLSCIPNKYFQIHLGCSHMYYVYKIVKAKFNEAKNYLFYSCVRNGRSKQITLMRLGELYTTISWKGLTGCVTRGQIKQTRSLLMRWVWEKLSRLSPFSTLYTKRATPRDLSLSAPHCRPSLIGRESLSSGHPIFMLSHTLETKIAELSSGEDQFL